MQLYPAVVIRETPGTARFTVFYILDESPFSGIIPARKLPLKYPPTSGGRGTPDLCR
ncbi:hypothetical protein J2X98_000999 [Pseudarthrobacter enclensis]|uniref:Uncharacterized protein n=1 Tax=Pseudarthrobacter enclensis TaxID=993070 RepID=A0ABT9RT80_9MICC|nr:hypothetical protein [Pseudarthrobacter enclensis]